MADIAQYVKNFISSVWINTGTQEDKENDFYLKQKQFEEALTSVLGSVVEDIANLKQSQSNLLDQIDNIAIDTNAVAFSSAKASETVTITDSVATLTPAKYSTYRKALVTVETAPFRYWVDGSSPNTTNGHLVNNGESFEIESNQDIANFKAIRTTSTSAVIQVSYFDAV